MGIFSLLKKALRIGRRPQHRPQAIFEHTEESGPEEKFNAPLDPGGRAAPTAASLTADFRILRASTLLQMKGPMPKFEQLRSEQPSAWFHPDAPPSAVLFVSHRWKTPAHPDPDDAQADAIRSFLTAVRDVDESRELSAFKRRRRVPSLQVHGIFQAAYFLENGIAFGQQDADARNDRDDESFLDRLGVWYDFSCMPQDGTGSLSLVPSLARIHELIGESTMLVLRWPGDDYDARAWCAAEISTEPDIERSQCKRIVLRLDQLSRPIPLQDLVNSEQTPFFDEVRESMAVDLKHWNDSPRRALVRLHQLYHFLADLEDERDMPLFTARRKPEIFRGQRTLLGEMITRLGSLSRRDLSLPANGRLQADVSTEVVAALRSAGLRCTNPEDLLFTGLMILYSRHRGAAQMARFYGACIERYFARKPLMLARYREQRGPYSIDVWWVFDDEPPDSPSWKPPRWGVD
ncbi:MAG TPA: hypothetical protein VEO54_01575 [Thermoanaerobaculia bacterium]|nr:hypothetical protein [Thermoanaerobaculia bacterium]